MPLKPDVMVPDLHPCLILAAKLPMLQLFRSPAFGGGHFFKRSDICPGNGNLMAVHQMSAAVLASAKQSRSPHSFDLEHCYGYDILQPVFAELILVSPDPVADLVWPGLMAQADLLPRPPLAAIQKALLVARYDQLLVIDSASPIGPVTLLDKAAALAEQRWDVMELCLAPAIQPVPLVFHRRCEKVIKRHLEKSIGDMDVFLRHVRTHVIDLSPEK